MSFQSLMSLFVPSRIEITTQILNRVPTLTLEAAGFLEDATKRTKQEEIQPGNPWKGVGVGVSGLLLY